MKWTTLKNILNEIPVNAVGYRDVPNGTLTPFVLWRESGSDNFPADNRVYKRIADIQLDLYTAYKDFTMEAAVEKVLDDHDIFWDKVEALVGDEATVMVSYLFQVDID